LGRSQLTTGGNEQHAIKLGPFVDEDDGKTAETGLAIAQADIRLSKNGGNFAQVNDNQGGGNISHDEFGWYDVDLDTTDTGTLGRLIVAVHESGALPVWREFMVVPSNEYDSLISGSDALQVDAVEISSDSAAADALELLAENAKGTDHKVLVSTDPQDLSATLDVNTKLIEGADPTDTIRDSVVDDATRIDASSVNAVEGKVNTVDSNVDAILLDTGTDGVVLADGAITAAKIAADAIGASELAADAAQEIADQVWDEAQADHTGAGTFGVIATEIASILTDTGTDGVALADGAITAAKIAADAIGASELAADAATEIADAILCRDWTSVSGEAARSVLNALRHLRNKWTLSGGTLTVTEEDDSTPAWTASVTTDPGAEPVTVVDPT